MGGKECRGRKPFADQRCILLKKGRKGKKPAATKGEDGGEYKNGELPPVEDTEGWTDPRLNGGRFIDVSAPLPSLVRAWLSSGERAGSWAAN